ncbi:MAG: hypothetical protein ABI551_19840 [Polyangiaceae bacterium]
MRVSTRGNSGVTGVLNRFDTVLDIRLVVPKSELDAAREAIEALNAPERQISPFRGFGKESATEAEEPITPRKKSLPRVVFVMLVVVVAGLALDYMSR